MCSPMRSIVYIVPPVSLMLARLKEYFHSTTLSFPEDLVLGALCMGSTGLGWDMGRQARTSYEVQRS